MACPSRALAISTRAAKMAISEPAQLAICERANWANGIECVLEDRMAMLETARMATRMKRTTFVDGFMGWSVEALTEADCRTVID